MPEIKNTFLAGKMNKGLDDRILPQGEYRDALNVQITKAEGPDVGVIHNIEGNQLAHTLIDPNEEDAALIVDSHITRAQAEGATTEARQCAIDTLSSYPRSEDYETIGSFFDEKNNRVFWFTTNNTNSYIYLWNLGDSTASPVVYGTWLNFNKSNKITGVNLLEDLLFWTDNRNQPRRINVTRANGSYYDSEVKVSVAKYAPYKAPQITSTTPSDFYDSSIRSERIKEEFVRFAYRYKFKDNEYSIISPFTPIAFRMSNNVFDTDENAYLTSDLIEVAAKTTVPNMVNGVNKVPMSIPLPTGTTGPTTDYEIEKIEILYKESDSTAIRIIETLDVTDSDGSSKSYTYKSSNFKATLPEDQLTRVFDSVPLKARAQEVAGNRVVYGNITTKQDLPDIDYTVTYSAKTSQEYILGNQNLKQRRTYEVGIVLSDIFGRTSPVILSDTSTVTIDAKDKNFDNSNFDGDSLKILFSSVSSTNLYSSSNITGWYSYRVVVKQKEQEYYNAYVPGIFNYGSLVSFFVIHGDNINKIPRETVNQDDNDLFSPASVRVYPKVLNVWDSNTTTHTYKNSSFDLLDIVDIGKLNDFGLSPSGKIYEDQKNHLIGKVETLMGSSYSTLRNGGDFAVLETEPFESALDIYYETPTTGLISEITGGIGTFAIHATEPISLERGSLDKITDDFSEANFANSKVSDIYARDTNGDEIPGPLVNITFQAQSSSGRYGVRFNNNSNNWEVYLANPFVYDGTTDTIEVATKLVTDTSPGPGTSTTFTVTEANANPECAGPSLFSFDGSNNGPSTSDPIFKVFGTNGSSKKFDSNNPSDPSMVDGLTFEFVKITQTHTGNSAATYILFDESTSTNENKFTITSNFDGTLSTPAVQKGTASIYYASTTQHHNVGDTFEFKIRCTETINSVTTQSNTITVTGTNIGSSAVISSDTAFSGQLYYASANAFSNAYDACQSPVSSSDWSSATIYYTGNDPFVVDTTQDSPGRMYANNLLSIPANAGWYKRTDTGVIGYYQILGNEPSTFAGWYYQTPAYCATLTEEDAQNNQSYSPPEENELVFGEPGNENPYGLKETPDENIP